MTQPATEYPQPGCDFYLVLEPRATATFADLGHGTYSDQAEVLHLINEALQGLK